MNGSEDVLFQKYELSGTLDDHFAKSILQVDSIPEAQFRGASDEEIVAHIVSEAEIQPIELHEDSMVMDQQETKIDFTGGLSYEQRERQLVPGLKVTVSIPFTGDPMLWKLRPSSYQVIGLRGHIIPADQNGIGHLDIVMQQPSSAEPESYKADLARTLQGVRSYLETQREQIDAANEAFPPRVQEAISRRRLRLKNHTAVADFLGIPLKKRPGTPDVSHIPVKRKLVKPLPATPSSPPEPGISTGDYEHILGVIRHEGRSFETTPSTFAVHDEEGLRDIIIAHLNGHYEGDATGETFRRVGKTDIRIEQDNRAAFVGECKVWRGPAELAEAIDQLLRYLTWRDCKTALVLFNKTVAGFSAIQAKVPEALAAHEKYVAKLDAKHPYEWRVRFRSTDDDGREITMHVFLFNLFVAE